MYFVVKLYKANGGPVDFNFIFRFISLLISLFIYLLRGWPFDFWGGWFGKDTSVFYPNFIAVVVCMNVFCYTSMHTGYFIKSPTPTIHLKKACGLPFRLSPSNVSFTITFPCVKVSHWLGKKKRKLLKGAWVQDDAFGRHFCFCCLLNL